MPKSVLITGATGGIGSAVAGALAHMDYTLVLHYHQNETKVQSLKTEFEAQGKVVRVLQFDVADRSQTKAVLEADNEQNGAYYGVICNAGVIRDQAFPAMSGDDWDTVLTTNLDSFYNILNPLIMPMVRAKQGGRIITMASVSGLMGNRGQT